jgi:hypothetical protein
MWQETGKREKEKKEMGEKEQGQSWRSPSFPSILCRNRFFAE